MNSLLEWNLFIGRGLTVSPFNRRGKRTYGKMTGPRSNGKWLLDTGFKPFQFDLSLISDKTVGTIETHTKNRINFVCITLFQRAESFLKR